MEFHFKVELFLFATFLAYCEVCIKYTHLFGNVFESVLQESLGQCIGDLKGHGGIFFCLDHSLRLKKPPKIIMNKHCLQVKLTKISIFCRISMLQIFTASHFNSTVIACFRKFYFNKTWYVLYHVPGSQKIPTLVMGLIVWENG